MLDTLSLILMLLVNLKAQFLQMLWILLEGVNLLKFQTSIQIVLGTATMILLVIMKLAKR